MKYLVFYNCKCIAVYKSLKTAVNFINRKGLQDDEDNMLYIEDKEGNLYSPAGEKVDFDED